MSTTANKAIVRRFYEEVFNYVALAFDARAFPRLWVAIWTRWR